MRVLFLDDDKTRVAEFEERTGLKVHHVLKPTEFGDAIRNQKYDVIMLDHDLGYEDNFWNGQKACKLLAANRSWTGDDQTVIIHSANPVGVANMMAELKHADHLHVSAVHWAWNRVSLIDGKLVFAIC